MRLYHPELDRTVDVGDSEALFEVMAASGWCKTIPAEHNDPALAPEQPDVVYQPVPAEKAKPAAKTTKSAKAAAATD